MAGRWVTGEEYLQLTATKEAEARAAYTWEDVERDLALLTSLTVLEASGVTYYLRETDLNPYDTFPWLRDLIDAVDGVPDPGLLGRVLQGFATKAKHRQIVRQAEPQNTP